MKIEQLRTTFKVLLISWLIALAGVGIFFFAFPNYEWIMLTYLVLYTIQASALLLINNCLNTTLTKIFEAGQFSRERSFLKCTLFVFSISYVIVVIRAVAIFVMVLEINARAWVC